MMALVVSADHVITVRDVVMAGAVLTGVAIAIVAIVGLLALMAKGWDH